MKNYYKLFLILISLIICHAGFTETILIDPDWYIKPEDKNVSTQGFLSLVDNNKMEKKVADILNTTLVASSPAKLQVSTSRNKHDLPNWTPWHLEVISTELSVSSSGLIGVLTGKGTATARAFWRRQGVKPEKNIVENEEVNKDISVLKFDDIYDESSLENELNPMIHASMSTGKIEDEVNFKKNLLKAARDFYFLTNGIQEQSKNGWWIGRLRFDLVVQASGKIVAAPVSSIGGEVRLRFDWRRLMRTKQIKLNYATSGENFLNTDLGQAKINFAKFVNNISNDLSSTFTDDYEIKGLKPFQFRVGLGVTLSGNVGIAKSSASAIAHVYFNRDQKMPTVYPHKLLPDDNSIVSDSNEPILLIENAIDYEHVDFAKKNNIKYFFDMGNTLKSVFKIDRNNFRKGMLKAVKIGKFFASAGQKSNSNNWKLYEMRTGFDMSLSGTIGLATAGGLATTQVNFINTNF